MARTQIQIWYPSHCPATRSASTPRKGLCEGLPPPPFAFRTPSPAHVRAHAPHPRVRRRAGRERLRRGSCSMSGALGVLKWKAVVSVLCVLPSLIHASASTPSLRSPQPLSRSRVPIVPAGAVARARYPSCIFQHATKKRFLLQLTGRRLSLRNLRSARPGQTPGAESLAIVAAASLTVCQSTLATHNL